MYSLLSQGPVCPKCGYANRQGARFCGGCGTLLPQAMFVAPHVGSQEKSRETVGWERPRWDNSTGEENRDFTAIGRTEKGIFLLVVSLILGPIPYLMYIGFVLGLVGAILVILGRKAFGQLHSNLVQLSVGIWIIGIIASFIVGASYGYDVASAILANNSQAQIEALNNAFNALVIGAMVSSAILGISQILITYALQTARGRLLLFFGYALGIALGVLVLSIISPQVNAAVLHAISTQDLTPLDDLRTQSQLLGLVGIIPAIISAFAFYLAYSRIVNGEIPKSTTLPAWS
ncbi:MAG TPA: zinc-ribbon domain-containing protein [Candidatus Bathyarchaeia archaeon]|nr:zinc-ribbon domain-containing protein [Candidatus Bathyarchaeia archaeon]